jgi:site-specific DNA-methyltransferase (adenine-specific)
MTPYYADDLVTIYHGDFREIPLAFVGGIDLAIADPPYGHTSLSWDRWVADWPEHVGALSLWVFGTLRTFMDHAADFRSWKLSQDIVWEKHNGSSLAADRFSRVHEQAAHFYRGRWADVYHVPPRTMDATPRTVRRKALPPQHQGARGPSVYTSVDGGPRIMRSVIAVRSTHGYAENETQKPVELLTPLIEYGCPPGGLVLDPFMGSGSTLIAARDSGRRAVGIDIREGQCEIAARRCQWLATA